MPASTKLVISVTFILLPLFIEFIDLEEGKMALNKIQKKLEAILVNSLDYSPLRPLLS